MTEATDPFKDNKDPFVPDTVRIQLQDGSDVIDVSATVKNHVEAPVPRIEATKMQAGDVLTVEFDNDYHETFEASALHSGSLVFGSEEITHRQVVFTRRSENGDEPGKQVIFYGSAISPTGMMMTPSTLRVGSYMVTDLGISTGTVRTFGLKRPDEKGELKDVMFNKTEAKPQSESFLHAKETFDTLEGLLEQDGFTFGDDNEYGLGDRYAKVNGDLLVHADAPRFWV